jgi:hypothetical protein
VTVARPAKVAMILAVAGGGVCLALGWTEGAILSATLFAAALTAALPEPGGDDDDEADDDEADDEPDEADWWKSGPAGA